MPSPSFLPQAPQRMSSMRLFFYFVQPRLNRRRIRSDRGDLTALAARADARVRMAGQDIAQIDHQLH